MMIKATLFEARPEEVAYRSSLKDDKRNHLGFIYKKDLDAFIEAFMEACKEHGEEARVYSKYHKDIRIAFSHSPLMAEIIGLSKKPLGEVGLILEEPTIGYDDISPIRDKDRLMIFIYFNINNKALTRLRSFLLGNILAVQKETQLTK